MQISFSTIFLIIFLKVRPWNNDLVVDWAEQQDEPDDEVMATVKVVYVKNLKESVTEERLKELFEQHGEVERAKKIRDYAFIHFKERNGALTVCYKTIFQSFLFLYNKSNFKKFKDLTNYLFFKI